MEPQLIQYGVSLANDPAIDPSADVVSAVDLPATELETSKGTHTLTALRFKTLTIVVLETADDLIIGGISVSRDPERAVSLARGAALLRLDAMRLKLAERAARRRMKQPALAVVEAAE